MRAPQRKDRREGDSPYYDDDDEIFAAVDAVVLLLLWRPNLNTIKLLCSKRFITAVRKRRSSSTVAVVAVRESLWLALGATIELPTGVNSVAISDPGGMTSKLATLTPLMHLRYTRTAGDMLKCQRS
jgi:hypothetical protein